MTVYVDEITDYGPKGLWCHMMTDNYDDLTELHALAGKIGLRRDWFQNHNPMHPHYDLRPSKRALAIKHGAVAISGIELAQRCSKLLRNRTQPEILPDCAGDLIDEYPEDM